MWGARRGALTIMPFTHAPARPPNPPTSQPSQLTASLTYPSRAALSQPYACASARLAAWA